MASLGDIPKKQAKGEKRAAPPPLQKKTPKRRKGGPSPSYAQVAKSQALNEEGDWQEVTRKTKKKEKKEKKAKDPVQKARGTFARPKLKRSSPARSGDAINVSARDGYGSRGCCNLDRKNACWRCGATGHLARSCKATPRCLTCLDRGDKDIAHVSGGGSCPVFREEL